MGDVPTDAPDDVDEEALDEEIRELALRLRRANEELASLEPAVDPEPVAKKLREIQEGRDGVLEKARDFARGILNWKGHGGSGAGALVWPSGTPGAVLRLHLGHRLDGVEVSGLRERLACPGSHTRPPGPPAGRGSRRLPARRALTVLDGASR